MPIPVDCLHTNEQLLLSLVDPTFFPQQANPSRLCCDANGSGLEKVHNGLEIV